MKKYYVIGHDCYPFKRYVILDEADTLRSAKIRATNCVPKYGITATMFPEIYFSEDVLCENGNVCIKDNANRFYKVGGAWYFAEGSKPIGYYKLTPKERNAVKTAVRNCKSHLNNCSEEEIMWLYEHDIVTVNKCRNGRYVSWFSANENCHSCIYVDTHEELSEKEIKEQLL